jgi:hypothetical protein
MYRNGNYISRRKESRDDLFSVRYASGTGM